MATLEPEASSPSPWRHVSWGAVATLTLSLLFVAWITLGLPGAESVSGFWLFLPVPLGFVGATLAAFSRRLSTDDRIGWALVSVIAGFVIVIAWFNLTLLIGGP